MRRTLTKSVYASQPNAYLPIDDDAEHVPGEIDLDYSTQAKVDRLPWPTMTDRWLMTKPNSDESRAALAELCRMARG